MVLPAPPSHPRNNSHLPPPRFRACNDDDAPPCMIRPLDADSSAVPSRCTLAKAERPPCAVTFPPPPPPPGFPPKVAEENPAGGCSLGRGSDEYAGGGGMPCLLLEDDCGGTASAPAGGLLALPRIPDAILTPPALTLRPFSRETAPVPPPAGAAAPPVTRTPPALPSDCLRGSPRALPIMRSNIGKGSSSCGQKRISSWPVLIETGPKVDMMSSISLSWVSGSFGRG